MSENQLAGDGKHRLLLPVVAIVAVVVVHVVVVVVAAAAAGKKFTFSSSILDTRVCPHF